MASSPISGARRPPWSSTCPGGRMCPITSCGGMTPPGAIEPRMPIEISFAKDVRKLLAFGSGVGIEIHGDDLEVVAARVRPSRVRVLGRLTIQNFTKRPAAEWGAEYTRFLKSWGVGYLSATVLLPRREVIVRQVALPGVAAQDIEGAIRDRK